MPEDYPAKFGVNSEAGGEGINRWWQKWWSAVRRNREVRRLFESQALKWLFITYSIWYCVFSASFAYGTLVRVR